jgi:beta-fructofuranosidase
MLSYTIDDKPVFSQNTIVPPGGLFGLYGYGGNFRVYDVICEGQFETLAAFYTKDFLLERAQTSVAKAAERVKDDPNRPAFHFQPPANWNNDPNGLLFHDGFYHLFYQHNPYGDRWDWMHWGHARSKDMVHWQRMPIALWPDISKGERHCFSGSGFITDAGKPILFYTSIGHENPEHWAAVPVDDQLEQWQKHQANPIIVMEDHGTQFIDGWRDPFLFREAGDTYMVIGGHPRGGTGSIMLYKALNPELTEWSYLGVPFSGEEKNWECPNFFKIDNKYVLIYSPHSQVKYITGTMDFDEVKFTPEYFGSVDNGSDWNYYAPNTLQMADGRRVLFGWIPQFKENQGWQGAISLPRDLAIDAKGRLIQTPVPELESLRGETVREENVILQNTAEKLAIQVPQFEMKINIAAGGTDQLGFRFNDENGQAYEINMTPQFLVFGEEKVAIEPQLQEKIRTVQFFFDRTVIEMIVNDGVLCATEVIYPDMDNLNFEIFRQSSDKVILASVDVWNIETIW